MIISLFLPSPRMSHTMGTQPCMPHVWKISTNHLKNVIYNKACAQRWGPHPNVLENGNLENWETINVWLHGPMQHYGWYKWFYGTNQKRMFSEWVLVLASILWGQGQPRGKFTCSLCHLYPFSRMIIVGVWGLQGPIQLHQVPICTKHWGHNSYWLMGVHLHVQVMHKLMKCLTRQKRAP